MKQRCVGSAAHLLERFVREHVAGEREKTGYHRVSRPEDSDYRQLEPPSVSFVHAESVVYALGAVCVCEVEDEYAQGCETADAI